MENRIQKIRPVVLTLVIVAALAAGGYYFVLPRLSTAAGQPAALPPVYQTAKVEKADLQQKIDTSGVVRANQTAVLPWQTTGTVSEVGVKVSQPVQAGTVLARLDPLSLPQNLILAQADLVTAQRALDNLRNSSMAQAQAQLAVTTAQKALDDANQHKTQLLYRASPDQVAGANAGYILAQDNVDRMQGKYDDVAGRPEDDATRALALANLENAKKARDKALVSLNWYKGKADPQDISLADGAIAVAQAKLDDAQREWDRLKNGPDPKDISAAQARVDALQAAINLARLKAPFSGTLTAVQAKLGDQVTPGTLAFQLDDLSRLLVDLSVTQADVNRVQTGQTAALTLEGAPGQSFDGLVTEVSLVGKSLAGTVNYTVTVEVSQKDTPIRPGMTVRAEIRLGDARQALLVPYQAVRSQGGKSVVYLLKGGTPTPVSVSLGTASGTFRELLSGEIQAGDLVILNPPAQP